MTPKFDKLVSVLMEMPVAVDGPITFKDLGYFRNYGQHEERAEFSINGLGVQVFNHINDKDKKKFYLVNNDKIIAEYGGNEQDGGIVTQYAHAEKFSPGESTMYHFYTKFLLKTYRFVISDDTLSEAGFNFFYRNFDRFKLGGYHIFVFDENYNLTKEIELADKEELKKYYGGVVMKPLAGKQRYKISS